MRASIAELPDGTYSAEDFLDNDGIVDEPLKIALDLTVEGETMTLDFSRCATGLRRPGEYLALDRDRRLLCRAEAPLSGRAGQCRRARRRSDFIIPEGSLLAAERPSPSAATPKPSCA